ncbi:hypothetical protein WALSEDRAFT_68055 [Wallemia mellicola CBS 633.66]|uniref:CDC14-domain-containing protein n=1 Tax=Wallemia mellicola (strain ATCC MYA-4683 / CBS 633.66) TaxID=671144 RepID=I4YF57_WALMC|nr:hypothetical protein WALSEDRAFT_68055 [Wallemia mellicola CBS 633.66]EIM22599.1 hypothetical protein WALSEDRAFT_68055 [Wallemia mellicola CBS 633.66]|eukprot:XP_006957268.1 hypothetical protein WALSEDRAFT_68055 [Wallemia mellicola CBS 633.66]
MEGQIENLIMDTIDIFTSIRCTSTERTTQLERLERGLGHFLSKGKTSALDFENTIRNLGSSLDKLFAVLLGHVRVFALNSSKGLSSASCTELSLCLSLLQVLSLLNADAQRSLSSKPSIDILLEVIQMSVLTTKPTDLQPVVAADALDALLCAVAGSSVAIRRLENIKGLECIVRVLRRKGVDPAVRVKSLELLYFYLLPEKDTQVEDNKEVSDDEDDGMLLDDNIISRPINKAIQNIGQVPYSPKSPLKKHKSSYSMDRTRRSSSKLRYTSFANTPAEVSDIHKVKHTRSQSDIRNENIPPVPPVPEFRQQSSQLPLPLPKTPEKKRIIPSSQLSQSSQTPQGGRTPRTPRTPKLNGEVRIPPPNSLDNTRTVEEKKAILSNWLGNVDALVRGMQDAGVWTN